MKNTLYTNLWLILFCSGLLSCNESSSYKVDDRLHGAWEFVLEEGNNEVLIYNHKGPVSYYYFSDTSLHFFSRHFKDENLEYEAFNCWTDFDKIYTTFDDTVKSSIFFKFRSEDTLILSQNDDFNFSMLFVKKDHALNQIEQLINATFIKINE